MAEQTLGVQTPESQTQEPAAPTGEQKITGSEQVPANELPNEASERTRERFDTLTKELAEERRSREALQKAFNTLKPKEEVETVQPIYDPNTGLLNEQALTNVQQRAMQAEREAQETKKQLADYLEGQKKVTQEREDQEAFIAHPELDPKNEKFNKDLRDVTASIMLQSMVHPENFGNKQLSHKEAGDKAKELVAKLSGNVKADAARAAIEQLSPKEQAALDATGSSKRGSQIDLSDLQRRTRKGDEDAMVDRLRRLNAS